jgi:hypothetical protein
MGNPPIQSCLGLTPTLERALALTKQERLPTYSQTAPDNLKSGGGEGDFMWEFVLGSLSGDAPAAANEVDLLARHASDLLPPLARKDQQADDASIVIVVAGMPNGRELLV